MALDSSGNGHPLARVRLDGQKIDALFSLNPLSAEARTGALQMLTSELAGDRLAAADLDDVGFLVGVATYILLFHREYLVVEEVLGRYFTHPDIQLVDWRSLCEFHVRLGFCALGQGQEVAALARFRAALATPSPAEPRLVACMIRNFLLDQGYYPLPGRSGAASAELTYFIMELVTILRGETPQRDYLPLRATYETLGKLLDETYGQPLVEYDPEIDGIDSIQVARSMVERTIAILRAQEETSGGT